MAQPDPYWGELNHGEEASGKLVVTSGDALEMFEFAEDALDEVALPIKALGEAEPCFAVSLDGKVGRCALVLNMGADAVGVVGVVSQDNDARGQCDEKMFCDLTVMCLSRRQADPGSGGVWRRRRRGFSS